MEAWVTRFPIGAEPGFQSVAMARIPPLSKIFLAGEKGSPNPKLAPGKATATVLELAKNSISSSMVASKWSADFAPTSTAILELPAVNWSA